MNLYSLLVIVSACVICLQHLALYKCVLIDLPTRFLLLSSNLATERLQIDTDLLHIIISTADELSRGTNIDDLERP